MSLMQHLLLCFSLSLALSGQHILGAPSEPGVLHCGQQSFQFTVNYLHQDGMMPVFLAWDHRGLPHRLLNSSECGTRVREDPGGSVTLEANYSGCYVKERGFYYTLPIGVEGVDVAGHTIFMKKRLLKCPVNFSAQDPSGADLCDSVPVEDRFPCVSSLASQRDCEELGCCFSPAGEAASSCYYGNTVTSHCSQEGHFSIAVSREVASPPLRLNSVHLALGNDSECEPVMVTHAFVLFQFPFTSCGTTSWVTGDQTVYENELIANRDVRSWDHGSITRDSIFRLQVSCSYSLISNTFPVNVQVFTLSPPLPKTQAGPLTLELQIAKDEDYSSYYEASDYPVVKFLRDPVYVEVSILHRTDPSLGLLLQQCWATPSRNPLHQPQWPILVKGCPYAGDNYRTQRIPVNTASSLLFPSHHQRFNFSTFSFVDSKRAKQALSGQVFLHCSASVCQTEGMPSCTVTCPPANRRRKSDLYFQNRTASISSKGPMILLQATEDPLEKARKSTGAPVDHQALWVAGLSGTFIIGASLVSYLAIRRWK
ncbi:PREDICTED: zona pellucida sperm-binding protein 4 [Chinchilla lanigera]|uniref:zona pellucida sperm-binding protein 4 n=1 Tax=Chinchilla lanigera TaxID=34839 RepID=UPI00038EB983|nr:PREDICTED: zona pellucida sperm-binding protein 4 [Chinchilla lanigera]